jgi:DNA-directed RNA polymerase
MMDNQALELPLEIERAFETAQKKNQRAIKTAGLGDSDVAMQITKSCVGKVASYIREQIVTQEYECTRLILDIITLVGHLQPELLALCGLNACLNGVAQNNSTAEVYRIAGESVRAEVWAAGLYKQYPALARRIEKETREASGGVNRRREVMRLRVNKALKKAKKERYRAAPWSSEQLVSVGNWLVNMVLAATPGLFEISRPEGEAYRLFLCADALQQAEDAVDELVLKYTPYLPKETKPAPWTSWEQVIDAEHCFSVSFLRTRHKDIIGACKAAIKDGSMQPALDAVNTLQSVPWRINKRVYGVLRACIERHIEVPGLPRYVDLPEPVLDKPWEELTDLEKKQYGIKKSEAKLVNAELNSERLMLVQDTKIAEKLHDAECFYTAMNCDWRGRVYALSHFNFQREDRVRALFEFANGEPIGEEGLYWLKVHVANCGDFNKISKRPLAERVQWVDDNIETIKTYAEFPLKELGWTHADSPFLFLAACMELIAGIAHGPTFVSRCPVSFDGSCSGLQHLSAMTRDAETAALVNLTPGDRPQDVYGVIAEDVKHRLENDADELAQKFLALGVDRKLAKRNVMTYSYSSKKYGMASQQQVDLMDEMYKEVVLGKREEHPFGQNKKIGGTAPTKAARYIASHIFDAIEERIHRPAQAMKFLQAIAKAMAHEGKPVIWKSPAGIPWVNRYHAAVIKTLRLWMHDRGVMSPIRTVVAVGYESEIDKDKAANGVAPNFVHALDASHLMLSVNAAAKVGITNIATVHDSFGCLASRATEFNKIIRAELVRMYETRDVLSEVLEQAKRDLTQHNWHRLPSVPQFGTLNLKEIEDATYAFA